MDVTYSDEPLRDTPTGRQRSKLPDYVDDHVARAQEQPLGATNSPQPTRKQGPQSYS